MKRARSLDAKDERKRQLAAAALEEFHEKGFAAARLDDIAARAGLSKGAIYLYFTSKEDLFQGVIEEFALPNLARIEAAAATLKGLGAIEAILALAPTIVGESIVPKIMKVLIGNAGQFPEMVSAYRRDVIDRLLGLVAGILQDAHDAGEIQIDNAALTARLVVAPVAFAAIWQMTFAHDNDASLDLEALFAMHRQHLLRALRPAAS